MACGKQDATRCLSLADDMTGSRCTQNPILPDQQLLDPVGRPDLCDQLHDLGVVVPSIASNDQERSLRAFWDRKEDAGDEGFAVVRLLEDNDLLAKPRSGEAMSVSTSQSDETAEGAVSRERPTHVPGF